MRHTYRHLVKGDAPSSPVAGFWGPSVDPRRGILSASHHLCAAFALGISPIASRRVASLGISRGERVVQRRRGYERAGALRASSVFIAAIVLLVGGDVVLSPRPASGQPTPAVTPSRELFSEFGGIETVVHQIRRPNCWTLILRGTFQNPYDEAVSGVRLIVRLRSAGDQPLEVERIETDLTTTLKPGQSIRFDRTLSTACSMSFNDISVVAFASHRGAVELPTPTREAEAQASQIQEAAASAGNIPFIGNVGSWVPNFR